MSEAKNNFDVQNLEKLVGNEKIAEADVQALKAVLDNKDDLFKSFFGTKLETKVQAKMKEIFKDLQVTKLEGLLKGDQLSAEEKNNLMLLLEKYNATEQEKAKDQEIQAMLQKVRLELQYFQGQVMEQSGYKAKKLRESTPSQQSSRSIEMASGEKAPESQPTSTGNGEISETELDNLEKFLGGKDILTDKLTRVEKSLKSDFMKMVDLLSKKTSLTKLLQTLNAQMKNNVAMPDWKTLFPKSNGEKYSEKDIKNLQKGYQAYLETKTSNPDLSRWNQILNLLETGILNEGKTLNTIKTESLNMPISKKERKQGLEDEQWRWRAELAKDGKASEWKTNYLKEHHAEIQSMQQMWLENGYSGAQISQMTKDFLEDQFDAYTKKEWKKHLKEQEKNGIQKSDLGKFRVLVDDLKDKSDQDRMLALMTDTNFDGMRNHLDGKGTKRGLQVDGAFHMALDTGKTPEEIVKNIGAFMEIRNPAVKVPTENVKAFADWLGADITNARAVQGALMDSPAQAMDIMTHGKDALKKTLEKNFKNGEVSDKEFEEFQQALENKIDTDPATKDLPEATKAEVMSSVSSYLLSKMQEKGANANVNGLGVGVNVPLSQILEGLSFTAGTGTNFDGGLFAGIGLAWNTKIASWETGSVDAGLKAGTTLGVIPIYGLRAGFEQDLNTKKVLGDIDPTALKSVSFGANMTMIGAMPSWGLNAGFDADKLKGIEKHYNAIKKDGLQMMKDLLKKADLLKGQDSNKLVNEIKNYLKDKYKESSDEDLAKAAENLSSALKLAEGLDQNAAAKVIADWYAGSWRTTAIQGLPKGRKPTGAGIGIQFLAGFFPVGSLSMTLTRYKNESYEDSPESRQALRQREELGIGNETAKEVKKSDFDRITTSLQRANILTQNEKLEMSDNGFVVMPVSLLNKSGLEVRIADHLKGYIKQNGNSLIVPANIDWRFLQASRTNGSRAVLNIGGDMSKGMRLLTPQNINKYVGEKNYLLDQNVKVLQQSLSALKLTNVEIKGGKLYQEGKEEEAIGSLDVDSGIKIDSDGNVSLTKEKGRVIKEKKLERKLDETVSNAIAKAEVVLNSIRGNLTAIKNQIRGSVVTASFAEEDKKTDSAGASATTSNKQQAPEATSPSGSQAPESVTAILSKKGYLAAADVLTKVLTNNQLLKDALNTTIDGNEGKRFVDPILAHQVIDQIKAILAEIPANQKNNLESLTTARERSSKKNFGGVIDRFTRPKVDKASDKKSDKELYLNVDYSGYANQLDTAKNKASVLKDNLIGFTAFYSLHDQAAAKGMSMTAYGKTNVLGQTFDLSGDQGDKAKTWILDNLKNHPAQMNMISKSLGKVAKADEKGVNNKGYLTDESLLTLLKDGEIKLDSGEKISINSVKPVAYFLAECANQSIGLEIGDITIESSQSIVLDSGSMTFNTSETDAQAHVQASQINLGVAFDGGKKGDNERKEDNGYGGHTKQEGATGSGTGTGGDPSGGSVQNNGGGWGIGTGGILNGGGTGGR